MTGRVQSDPPGTEVRRPSLLPLARAASLIPGLSTVVHRVIHRAPVIHSSSGHGLVCRTDSRDRGVGTRTTAEGRGRLGEAVMKR